MFFFLNCQFEYIFIPSNKHFGVYLAGDLKLSEHKNNILNKAYKHLGLL